MPPSFARIAPSYDALRPLSRADRERLQRLVQDASLTAGDTVVEVGCGTGRLTLPMAALTPAQVIGIDSEARMLEVSRSKDEARRVEWILGSAYRLPLPDGRASLVLMAMVVHLLRQRGRAFGEARRILRPGGRLHVWTFTPRHVQDFYLNEYFPSIPRIDSPRFPSPEVLTAELRRAGFEWVKTEIQEEPRRLQIAEVVDRVRGRYISTLAMLPPLEYRLGLQRLEEALADDRSIQFWQRTEWALLSAQRSQEPAA
jgi:ubiquinone/menaquinone biosynthesis C-methylase UbiE